VKTDSEDEETGPLRRCISTGESLEVARMIRFVVGPEDRLVPDIAGKLPGRGIWVSANRKAIETLVQFAVDQQIIPKTFRPEDLFAPNTLDLD